MGKLEILVCKHMYITVRSSEVPPIVAQVIRREGRGEGRGGEGNRVRDEEGRGGDGRGKGGEFH